jgi:hypothetical protein
MALLGVQPGVGQRPLHPSAPHPPRSTRAVKPFVRVAPGIFGSAHGALHCFPSSPSRRGRQGRFSHLSPRFEGTGARCQAGGEAVHEDSIQRLGALLEKLKGCDSLESKVWTCAHQLGTGTTCLHQRGLSERLWACKGLDHRHFCHVQVAVLQADVLVQSFLEDRRVVARSALAVMRAGSVLSQSRDATKTEDHRTKAGSGLLLQLPGSRAAGAAPLLSERCALAAVPARDGPGPCPADATTRCGPQGPGCVPLNKDRRVRDRIEKKLYGTLGPYLHVRDPSPRRSSCGQQRPASWHVADAEVPGVLK